MVKIKVISNPYRKELTYQKWETSTEEWKEISYAENKNSQLMKDKLVKGFFPFHMEEVVNTILEEYGVSSSKLNLYFEGTDDEYSDLEEFCSRGDYPEKLNLQRSSLKLENGRDILPQVIQIFKEANLLVSGNIEQELLTKFEESSNDIIPLVVLGNYSAGKSTFINALIGREFLPSGDHPTTAKIYKVSPSISKDEARLTCVLNNIPFSVKIGPSSYTFEGIATDSELVRSLNQTVAKIEQPSLEKVVATILEFFNDYSSDQEVTSLSELVEIEVPFSKSILSKSSHRFVIFDTPGSNSASNVHHYEVLEKAMKNMNNGLPIFVSEYTSLDSTDNERLYDDIRSMEGIDERFGLIVVNKADIADLKSDGFSEEDIQDILNQSIPRHMYSEGIFFVSSIMGLGSKNEGKFLNKYYERAFKNNVDDFCDEASTYYQSLYKYNILPGMLKSKLEQVGKENQNLLYANSGFLSVEEELEKFASKYVAYNKCQQSKIYLDEILKAIAEHILQQKELAVETRQLLERKLDEDKRDLIKTLREKEKELHGQSEIEFKTKLQEESSRQKMILTKDFLGFRVNQIQTNHEEELNFGAVSEQRKKAIHQQTDNLTRKIKSIWDNKNLAGVEGLFSQWQEDDRNKHQKELEYKKVSDAVKERTSQQLLQEVKAGYQEHLDRVCEHIFMYSKNFWEENTQIFKKAYSRIINGSDVLSSDRREDIEKVIVEYQELRLEAQLEEIFARKNLLEGLMIGDFQLFGDPLRLDLTKLVNKYNKSMEQETDRAIQEIRTSHQAGFETWMRELFQLIEQNIIDFSPDLQNTNAQLKEQMEIILDLESRQEKLDGYIQQIKEKMNWKEV